MERNQLTTMGNLTVGDRFYLANVEEQMMWEVKAYGRYHNYCNNGFLEDDEMISKSTQVKFISHKKQKT